MKIEKIYSTSTNNINLLLNLKQYRRDVKEKQNIASFKMHLDRLFLNNNFKTTILPFKIYEYFYLGDLKLSKEFNIDLKISKKILFEKYKEYFKKNINDFSLYENFKNIDLVLFKKELLELSGEEIIKIIEHVPYFILDSAFYYQIINFFKSDELISYSLKIDRLSYIFNR